MSIIGLDLGTSRVKAVRFDDEWRAADTEGEDTTVSRSGHGWCEQDMDEVWAAAARVVRAVVERAPDPITLLALTAQGDGCWLIDGAGDPVRPAILWNDNRSAPIIDGWDADGTLEKAFRRTGCFGAAGLAHAQLRWLAEHEPQTLARASRLLSCGSWVYHRLTGLAVLEVSDAANPFLDARSRTYDGELLDLYGLSAHSDLLPEVVSGSRTVNPLSPAAAAQVGLAAGTPVVIAPYDVVATATGTGVVAPGQAFAVLGTTLCVGVVRDDPLLSRPANGMTLPGTQADRWLIAYATMAGTEVLGWTARLLGLASASDVVALAASSDADDLPLVLPYLSPAGERSPFRDSRIRGSALNLALGQGPAEFARGALEGLTLAVVDCLHAAGDAASLALSGGGARSELWCQFISDAAGIPVVGPDTAEIGARGAALTGAVNLGVSESLDVLTAQTVRAGKTYTPRPEQTERLTERYQQFVAAR